ncbi:FAD/NAD(P)-binding oxidoreductase [Acidothermaceae bacterium B102]|nr:FAD/NAD(P)-binding oxidoreductase [Acidothermaceae bacterium B102]
MTTRVVVLGAGFGGLEVSSRLSEELGSDVDVVLVDAAQGFVFGFSKLDVMFGRVSPDHVTHRYADIAKPGVRFVRSTVRGIDPVLRQVRADDGTFDADFLVVALGADVDPAATPGLVEGGQEFYSVAGARAARDLLADFTGGRVVVGVTSTPFKCPPAPSETALLVDELLRERGLRDVSTISLVMPLGVPIPPSPQASATLLAAFEERGIAWRPGLMVTGLDVDQGLVLVSDGEPLPYDLFLGVPKHRVPDVVAESGMTVDGWIPVDPLTLETAYPGVFAVGDVTSVGTPKAGVFAERQGAVVAQRIIDTVRGAEPVGSYDGRGICYLEVGGGQVGKVDVTFRSGQAPVGDLEGPSVALASEKNDFGQSRVARWFGRDWRPLG